MKHFFLKKQHFFYKKFIKNSKQHPINIKNYTAHPHDMVRVSSYSAKRDGQTDRRTDGQTGGIAIAR